MCECKTQVIGFPCPRLFPRTRLDLGMAGGGGGWPRCLPATPLLATSNQPQAWNSFP